MNNINEKIELNKKYHQDLVFNYSEYPTKDHWDFSFKGIIRQVTRMKELADKSKKKYVVADFVCPYKKQMEIFKPKDDPMASPSGPRCVVITTLLGLFKISFKYLIFSCITLQNYNKLKYI